MCPTCTLKQGQDEAHGGEAEGMEEGEEGEGTEENGGIGEESEGGQMKEGKVEREGRGEGEPKEEAKLDGKKNPKEGGFRCRIEMKSSFASSLLTDEAEHQSFEGRNKFSVDNQAIFYPTSHKGSDGVHGTVVSFFQQDGTFHYKLKVSTPQSSSATMIVTEADLFTIKEYEAKKEEEILGVGYHSNPSGPPEGNRMIEGRTMKNIKTRQKEPLQSLFPLYTTDHQGPVEEAFMELFGCYATGLSPHGQQEVDEAYAFQQSLFFLHDDEPVLDVSPLKLQKASLHRIMTTKDKGWLCDDAMNLFVCLLNNFLYHSCEVGKKTTKDLCSLHSLNPCSPS